MRVTPSPQKILVSLLSIWALLYSVNALAQSTPDVKAISPYQYVVSAPARVPQEVSALDARVQIIGDLERDTILSIVQAEQADVAECYKQALEKNPDLAGEITLQWEITPLGNVRRLAIVQDQVSNHDLTLCVVKEAYTWKFPKTESKLPVGVNFPFQFGATTATR